MRPILIKNYFDINDFNDCSKDPQVWFENVKLHHIYKENVRSVYQGSYNVVDDRHSENIGKHPFPQSIVDFSLETFTQRVTLFLNMEEGYAKGLSKHHDNTNVYAFNLLGTTVWEGDGYAYEVEPLDLFFMPAKLPHEVRVISMPRISFSFYNLRI